MGSKDTPLHACLGKYSLPPCWPTLPMLLLIFMGRYAFLIYCNSHIRLKKNHSCPSPNPCNWHSFVHNRLVFKHHLLICPHCHARKQVRICCSGGCLGTSEWIESWSLNSIARSMHASCEWFGMDVQGIWKVIDKDVSVVVFNYMREDNGTIVMFDCAPHSQVDTKNV